MVTKARLIYGDIVLLFALCALYFVTEHLTKNLLPMGLVYLLLGGRSIFWHVSWYKKTGKIY
jgi:hypothetical protein